MTPIMGTPVLFVNRFSVINPDNNVGMTIGQRLRQARKAAKLTQEELAIRTGIKQSTLSDLELGKSAGSTSCATIAHALNVDALWLETGRGSRDISRRSEEPGASDWLTAKTPEETNLLTAYRLADEVALRTFTIVTNNVLTQAQESERSKSSKGSL